MRGQRYRLALESGWTTGVYLSSRDILGRWIPTHGDIPVPSYTLCLVHVDGESAPREVAEERVHHA